MLIKDRNCPFSRAFRTPGPLEKRSHCPFQGSLRGHLVLPGPPVALLPPDQAGAGPGPHNRSPRPPVHGQAGPDRNPHELRRNPWAHGRMADAATRSRVSQRIGALQRANAGRHRRPRRPSVPCTQESPWRAALSNGFPLAAALSLLGDLARTFIGVTATITYALTQHWGVRIPGPAMYGGIAAALAIGAIAGLYPATRAVRLSPTEALRTA